MLSYLFCITFKKNVFMYVMTYLFEKSFYANYDREKKTFWPTLLVHRERINFLLFKLIESHYGRSTFQFCLCSYCSLFNISAVAAPSSSKVKNIKISFIFAWPSAIIDFLPDKHLIFPTSQNNRAIYSRLQLTSRYN